MSTECQIRYGDKAYVLLQGGVVHGSLLQDDSLKGLDSLLIVLVVLVGKALVNLLELVVVQRLVVQFVLTLGLAHLIK